MKKTIPTERKLAWYNEPLNPETDFITLSNGVCVIPFEIIEKKLDRLCGGSWSTSNFVHSYHVINGNEAISASIELSVAYSVNEGDATTFRTLVGACTYSLNWLRDMNKMPELEQSNINEHYAASAKSLCIVNAAKSIGIQFGRDLNRKEFINVGTSDFPPLGELSVRTKDEKRQAIQDTILMSNTREMAQGFLNKSYLKNDEKLQALVNQKPSSLLKDLMK